MRNSKVNSIRVIGKNGESVYTAEFAEITAAKVLSIMAHHAEDMHKWAIRFARDKEVFSIEGTTLILKPLSVVQQIKCGIYIACNKHREYAFAIEESLSSWSETIREPYNLRHTA